MHVIVVANHWGVKENNTFAGIFIDRQIDSLRKAGIQVSTFDIGIRYSPKVILDKVGQLRKMASDLNVDLVHARYGTIIALISVLSGLPTIITFGGSDLLPGASVSFLRTYLGILISNIAALKAKAVICVSEELRQSLWWRKKSVHVIPDGVDIDIFSPGDQHEARNLLGWELDHPIVIINAARDPENKGLPLAQTAMQFVNEIIPEAELKIIQGVPPDKMSLWYRAADVLLSASRQEGSPNVIKEALACNLPVVSTPVGDASERLSGVHPSFVIPRNSEAISKAIVEIFRKCERSNGREFVKDFNLDTIASRVIQVYQSCI